MTTEKNDYEKTWADQVPEDKDQDAARKRVKALQDKAGEAGDKQHDEYAAAFNKAPGDEK